MSSRSVSPGGALLRSSRMFSLPKPIPAIKNEHAAGSLFHSTTSTLPAPTHQVVTTLSAPRRQGDWGLKRPLPLKSTTKTTNPMLRVRAIDSSEHITDYVSAADHGITLRKFQELGLPMTVRRACGREARETSTTGPILTKASDLPQRSVFEDQYDTTDIPADKRAETVDNRWRFEGPWLAGMAQGSFIKWLAKEVRPKRAEFRQFLKKKLAHEQHAAAAKYAIDKALPAPEPIDASAITEDQLVDYLRELRNNNQALYEMVGQFLDLAPLNPPTLVETGMSGNKIMTLKYTEAKSPYADTGPPITHPSAGLSYLRTSMYMANHPVYGPQKEHIAAPARVVRPRRQGRGMRISIGVAGFIANTSIGDMGNARGTSPGMYDTIDPELPGGVKLWVCPTRATMDASGTIAVTVKDSSPEAATVARELLGEADCLSAREAQATRKPESSKEIRQRYRAAPGPQAMSSARDYGLQE
ncbi:mitochondrial ribosomal protein MRP51 [Chaetomium sp. MPI-SDFR-AT-0129]|nr:mitochondrial ribosomal protein MRP51 [Chaetomium sp. MPI-SDFR-AT-0129]